jgi:hypothetical protein
MTPVVPVQVRKVNRGENKKGNKQVGIQEQQNLAQLQKAAQEREQLQAQTLMELAQRAKLADERRLEAARGIQLQALARAETRRELEEINRKAQAQAQQEFEEKAQRQRKFEEIHREAKAQVQREFEEKAQTRREIEEINRKAQAQAQRENERIQREAERVEREKHEQLLAQIARDKEAERAAFQAIIEAEVREINLRNRTIKKGKL